MHALTTKHALLDKAISSKASDLHLNKSEAPWLRVNSGLTKLEEDSDALLAELKTIGGTRGDFAFTYANRRWRVGIGSADGKLDAVLRLIPDDLIPIDLLGLPEAFMARVRQMEGLILITAPTGSGKTTTLNSVIDHINSTEHTKIITLEDPVEFLHRNKKSLIRQRELHSDFPTFAHAIERALRQDPDIIVVGEIRDIATLTAALSAAETGHLVFGTLHTRNASSSLSRILDMASDREAAQIRAQCAQSLVGVLAQRLVRAVKGGRVAAYELLVKTPAVASIISSNKLDRLQAEITTTSKQTGMISMDQSLAQLVKRQIITKEEGQNASEDPTKFLATLSYA
jgi:twitching motility protein PilT